MPSSKVKPPSKYLLHWHSCMAYLAAREHGGEILIDEVVSDKHRGTVMAKLRAMRESIRRYPGWPAEVRAMVLEGELHFEARGVQVWAVRRARTRTIAEILRASAKK